MNSYYLVRPKYTRVFYILSMEGWKMYACIFYIYACYLFICTQLVATVKLFHLPLFLDFSVILFKSQNCPVENHNLVPCSFLNLLQFFAYMQVLIMIPNVHLNNIRLIYYVYLYTTYTTNHSSQRQISRVYFCKNFRILWFFK